MKYTRNEMLKDFKELELDLEGNTNNMHLYEKMSNDELERTHREMLDAKYEV